MPVIEIDERTRIETDRLVKVAFEPDATSPLGQRADLFVVRSGTLAPAVAGKVDSIPALQHLRALVGSGTGETGWVRVRSEGTTGDRQDTYANLNTVLRAEFASAADGAVARLEGQGGTRIGEVHLPAAIEAVRSRGLPGS